jgi:hypothetical protein
MTKHCDEGPLLLDQPSMDFVNASVAVASGLSWRGGFRVLDGTDAVVAPQLQGPGGLKYFFASSNPTSSDVPIAIEMTLSADSPSAARQ